MHFSWNAEFAKRPEVGYYQYGTRVNDEIGSLFDLKLHWKSVD